MPELTNIPNPMRFEAAVKIEKERAEDLREGTMEFELQTRLKPLKVKGIGGVKFSVKCRELRLATPEYDDALKLRAEVLRKPLGLELTKAELTQDPMCFHLGHFAEDWLVAVLLLQPSNEETVKMRQVAVHPDFQKSGIGSQLVSFAEAFALTNGYRTIIAHARRTAVGFYLKIGYATSGGEFIETTIPHQLVIKNLGGSAL